MIALADGSSWWPLVLGAVFAFAESALGVGAFLPGEVAITGLSSSIDVSQTVALIVLVTLGAVAGDHLGYFLGRGFGPRLYNSALIKRVGQAKWDAASNIIDKYGLPALVVSRLLPVIRTVMPAVAGAGGFAYRRFLFATVLGSTVWASLWVLAGNVVGAVLSRLLGHPVWLSVAIIGLVSIAVVVRVVRRRVRPVDEVLAEASEPALTP